MGRNSLPRPSLYDGPLLSTELYLAVKFLFFSSNCSSKLRFFPQYSLFLLVLQTCTDMKLALHVLGKYPRILNIFGEAKVSLGLRSKMVFVNNETLKC